MASFSIYPLSRFESSQTSIRRPRHFLQFSFNENHEVQVGSEESLRYYYPPYIGSPGMSMPSISLSNGFDTWIRSDQNFDGHLDALLATIHTHEESLLEEGGFTADVKIKADFITWRGMMTKIMTAAFDDYSDFEMNATCYQDTIYIEENHAYGLQREKKDNKSQNIRQQLPGRQPQAPAEMMQYWGYKFENLSTLPKPWSECSRQEIDDRDNEPVNNNIQYCSIVRTGIGQNTLIIGGEVDCVMGEKPLNPADPIHWVELKTSREPGTQQRQQQTFERKLCRMWAQSFLLGVPTIIVGFRDDNGYLTRITEMETQRIPGQVARTGGTWNGNVCITMTDAFLEFLKKTIMGTEGVWRITHRKGDRSIDVKQVEATGTGDVVSAAFKAHREKLLAVEIARKLESAPTSDG